jgi:penicillin-binding protein 1A
MESSVASKKVKFPKKTPPPAPERRKWIPKTVKGIWIVFICIITLPPLYVYTVSIDLFGLFGGMPGYAAIENPENDLSSEVMSADGVSLGRYFRYNRSQVTYQQLSPHLVNTLLLSEDHRFYGHAGMDFWAYPRVLWGIITFNSQGGGSTITQQLAKNLYTLNPELDGPLARLGAWPRRIVQKTKEWIISIQLERNFTKEEIITMYLNTSAFGSNAYGIKVASETYFNKQPSALNIQESAVLVGLLQNPSLYNPYYRPESAFQKRNQVLRKLYRHEYITAEAYDSLKSLRVALEYDVQNQNDGLGPYFREMLKSRLAAWSRENGHNLLESGLKIFTTIDSRMQRYGEAAMRERMAPLQAAFQAQWNERGSEPWVDAGGYEIEGFLEKKIKRTPLYETLVEKYVNSPDSVDIMLNLKKRMRIFGWNGERDTLMSSLDSLRYYNRFLHAGLMAMDSHTGEVKAWVGGINHKYFKYDHVRSGNRQPGSTFKPFVYGKAIEEGYSPCYTLFDLSPSITLPDGRTWQPPNAEGDLGSGTELTLRRAMALSKNTISAQLIELLKPANVAEFAHRLGITSYLDPVPSLCLGTSPVSLHDMVAAYSSFVNLGMYTEPFLITRIEDKNGNVIESFIPQTRQVMDEKTAYKMLYMLMGGVEEEGGTSVGIDPFLKLDNELGGKTGTTDNASDGWYMGVTHNLVTGVWVGGDEPSIHFPSWVFGSGGRTARPIWEKFMTKVYQDSGTGYGKGKFKTPTDGLDMTLDCSKYDEPGLQLNP